MTHKHIMLCSYYQILLIFVQILKACFICDAVHTQEYNYRSSQSCLYNNSYDFKVCCDLHLCSYMRAFICKDGYLIPWSQYWCICITELRKPGIHMSIGT